MVKHTGGRDARRRVKGQIEKTILMNKKRILITGISLLGLGSLVYFLFFSVSAPIKIFQKEKAIDAEKFFESQTNGGASLAGGSWTDPLKPSASLPLSGAELAELKKAAIIIEASDSGFNPKEITVTKGQKIILVVKSIDGKIAVFKFSDPALSEVAVGVANNETRAIAFMAPDVAGEYSFYNDIPGHYSEGGKVKVK